MRRTLLIALSALGLAVSTAQSQSARVILLGSGTPRPSPDVFGPSTAVIAGDRTLLFDAGAGVMHQMASANLGIRGPHALFVSHLHSDHTVGLPDLIFTSWVMERTQPFAVYGPAGIAHMVDRLAEAWTQDIRIRSYGAERNSLNGWRVNVKEIEPGVAYDSAGVRVTALQVPHGEWPMAFAYRVDTPDRSVVISGDTRASTAVAQLARNVDVLVHSVYPEWGTVANPTSLGHTDSTYFRMYHTSSVELGRLASLAQPKLLLLTHVVRAGATDAELIAGIRTGGYTGSIVVGKELVRY
ncbi:MAG: MBL fold metallo-hydrolase [Gemmatimonadaceae bacterium]